MRVANSLTWQSFKWRFRLLADGRPSLSTHHGNNCGCLDRDPPSNRFDNDVQLARHDHHRAFTVRIIGRRLACRPCPASLTRESCVRTVCSQVATGRDRHQTSASPSSERSLRSKSIMPFTRQLACAVCQCLWASRASHTSASTSSRHCTALGRGLRWCECDLRDFVKSCLQRPVLLHGVPRIRVYPSPSRPEHPPKIRKSVKTA